jgi:hypothetical protein
MRAALPLEPLGNLVERVREARRREHDDVFRAHLKRREQHQLDGDNGGAELCRRTHLADTADNAGKIQRLALSSAAETLTF